jgi:hypothetical protein
MTSYVDIGLDQRKLGLIQRIHLTSAELAATIGSHPGNHGLQCVHRHIARGNLIVYNKCWRSCEEQRLRQDLCFPNVFGNFRVGHILL